MVKVERKGQKAVLTLYGTIGEKELTGENVSSIIMELNEYSAIDIRLHTPGGSVFDGNVIINAIKNSKANIDIYVDGLAASMGAIMLTAARKVYIAENGLIMIHQPSSAVNGKADSIESCAKILRNMEDNFVQVLCAKTGKKESDIRELFSGVDRWFNAKEAKELGIVDYIIPSVSNIKALDRSVKELSSEKAFAYFEASLCEMATSDEIKLKEQLSGLLGLQAYDSNTRFVDAVSLLTGKTPDIDYSINNALAIGAIDAYAVDSLKDMGKFNPAGLTNYLKKLEEGKKKEIRAKVETLFKDKKHLLFLLSDEVQETVKNFACTPQNYEIVEMLISNRPRKSFTAILEEQYKNKSIKESWTLEDYRREAPDYLRQNPAVYAELVMKENEKNNNI